jgi:ATP-binding protein involved in chromosome partitioning
MKLEDVPTTILVASGKGGVGKTTVASDIARAANEMGYNVGLIDADVSTPNSPSVVGGGEEDIGDQRLSDRDGIIPPTVDGIQVISQALVLPDGVANLRDGTFRAQVVGDYVENVKWDDETDLVVIDTPPGTGEELQVIISAAPPDHAFIVTTPHSTAVGDAKKTKTFFDQYDVTHDAVVNMTHIPSSSLAGKVMDEVDFEDVDGIGKAKHEQIEELVFGNLTDHPMFTDDEGAVEELGAETVTRVPYTPDFDQRKRAYSEVLRQYLDAEEVEA